MNWTCEAPSYKHDLQQKSVFHLESGVLSPKKIQIWKRGESVMKLVEMILYIIVWKTRIDLQF